MFDTKELFRALEFAHYAERFREEVFVVALPGGHGLSDLLLDFQVLAGYHIRVVLVTQDLDFNLEKVISQANRRGARFELSLVTDLVFQPEAERLELDFGRISNSLARGKFSVIAYHSGQTPSPPGGAGEPSYLLAAAVSARMHPRKLFLVNPHAGPMRRLAPHGSVPAAEVEALIQRLHGEGMAEEAALCEFVASQLKAGIPDVVLLEGLSGELFAEVFTHDGAGILFNASTQVRIRKADLTDVNNIALLLRPDIEAGRILPSDENRIEGNIANYWIYEINGMAVGLACLRDYGGEAELGQFCTLPRYRGKGRAKELARYLIDQARGMGYKGVFALSIDDRMWEFFLSLGFERVARESLPESWRDRYDLSRPSRAFRMAL